MSDQETAASSITFADLDLPAALLQATQAVGYETPSPIQAQTIPHLLGGRDVLGQAQTGTGKTAAFALPTLAKIDVNQRAVQALVLAPTRELAIQVAEAFQKYASHMPGFHVLPIYGGQSYQPQLSALKRGAHVVVGTPGRVMDHLKRGTLNLSNVRMVVLDEADEMLNMGFLEDVEWILQQMPKQRQVALFSATMPNQIKRIAQTYLNEPAEVLIRSKTTTATNIRQRYWMVSGLHKLDALTRMLEVETFDAMIIFARTKVMTEELAEKLEARGYAVAPLNGDVPQQVRERTVQRLRDGQLDIIVATDVAARGLNVERISHVVNYDIPLDIESYVHRIGRTGRAGRSGEAILFVSPRERRMLAAIERATRQPIEHMTMPTVEDVNNQRIVRFKARITETIENGELELFREVIEQFEQEQNVPAIEIAAALARMAQGKTPLLLRTGPRERFGDRSNDREAPRGERPVAPRTKPVFEGHVSNDAERAPRQSRDEFVASESSERPAKEFKKPEFKKAEFKKPFADEAGGEPARERPANRIQRFEPEETAGERRERAPEGNDFAAKRPKRGDGEVGMETYRVAVGEEHQVKPGNIVGAIANEAGIDSKFIGRIQIFDNYSLVDLPEGMPKEVLQHLKKVWVAGQELRISLQRPGGSERGMSERTENSGYPARSSRPAAGGAKRFDRDQERPRRTLNMEGRGPARERSDRKPGPGAKRPFNKGAPRGRK
ncbi:MAG: DEAD/DEAH box helicase [Steroidobacteraceae bacterium]